MVRRRDDADSECWIGLLLNPRLQILHFLRGVFTFELFDSIDWNAKPDQNLSRFITEVQFVFSCSPLLSPCADDPLRFFRMKHSSRRDDPFAVRIQLCSPCSSFTCPAAQHDDDVKRFARDAVDLFPKVILGARPNDE